MVTAIAFLARSAWLSTKALWLDYEIHETEAYLRDCARDGLRDSLHLTYWRQSIGAMRARQIALREDARYARHHAAMHARTALAHLRRKSRHHHPDREGAAVVTVNLNRPAIVRGKLHQADFVPTFPAPPPTEACTDFGCRDDDTGPWEPAALADVLPLRALVLVVIAAAVGVFLGPDLLAWLAR